MRAAPSVIVGILAVLVAGVVFGTLEWKSRALERRAGLLFDRGAIVLPADLASRLGGPLTPEEVRGIETLVRQEAARAFAGMALTIVDDPDAFWRVTVRATIKGRYFAPSGESYGLGPLGGGGGVSFEMMARNAIAHAPPGASRADILAGMGRGAGRSAAHEFAHVILGPAGGHSRDERSYEFYHSSRPAQYYGELYWTTNKALLQDRLSR